LVTGRDLAAPGYRRIILLLVGLVIVPTGLLTAVGILLLSYGHMYGASGVNLVMGILVLCFTGLVVTGGVLVWVFVQRAAGLSKLQSDFVSKVSHELRTPLTSIRMFTETVRLRQGEADVVAKCMAALASESLRLQTLIDRLLDWGQMESGRRSFTYRETDAAQIIEAAVQSFEPTRERREVEIEISVPPGLPSLYVDHEAMVDAVVNLLSNAYKYGGDPRTIRIGATALDDQVRISVQDNGPGIARAEQKRVFQKFYRIDDRLSREKEGSGLGLAIVTHIVRAHGGRIELESEPGRGSTFTIALVSRRSPERGR
jgi:two-component system, OmpR family, phosphate regulon sensor histidine kinase PhoR